MMPALIDILIIVLLVGTLVYAFILDRRVRALMATLKEMEPMVGAFSNAVDQSAKSVEDLRAADDAELLGIGMSAEQIAQIARGLS